MQGSIYVLVSYDLSNWGVSHEPVSLDRISRQKAKFQRIVVRRLYGGVLHEAPSLETPAPTSHRGWGRACTSSTWSTYRDMGWRRGALPSSNIMARCL